MTMATTKKTKWSEILASYDALIAQIWDMAFDGALSDNEAEAANIIVKQYNDFQGLSNSKVINTAS